MIITIILLTVVATSILSGILGMAGGMVLMAVLASTLTISTAMILHGAVQMMANGSRAWFLRRYIRWSILPLYGLGAAVAVVAFALLALIPHPGLVLILVGAFPWLARYSKRLSGLDITQPTTSAIAGVAVTSAQLLAGASGPLLDVFYLRAQLTREEIVASKALTQALGHIIKIIYYGFIVGSLFATEAELAAWFVLAAMALAVLGTRIGTWILARWNDRDFQKVSQTIILTIATVCIAQGVIMLI